MNNSADSGFINLATGRVSITESFGENVARLLAAKIVTVYPEFSEKAFIASVKHDVIGKRYTERVEIIAHHLRKYLPPDYGSALSIMMQIVGPENIQETGMFTNFYWLMPVGKFIELYGLDDFDVSIKAIEEVTKRNTGEYAIRPFARKYPDKVIRVCMRWAKSSNFHLRRLASEGLRPKLPWSAKLDVWHTNPEPIVAILELLKEDEVKFVQKSVSNHLRDWTKVNPELAQTIIDNWSKSTNKNTKWIVKHAQR